MSRAVRIGFRSGGLHGEIQSARHGIIQTGGALQVRDVRIADGSLHLEGQVSGETPFLQRCRTIHIQVRAAFLNDAVMHGNARGRVLHVTGKLIDVNAPGLCRWLWRRRRRRLSEVEERFLFRRRLSWWRRTMHCRHIDVSEVRGLYVAGNLRIIQPAAECAVEACPAWEFYRGGRAAPGPETAE